MHDYKLDHILYGIVKIEWKQGYKFYLYIIETSIYLFILFLNGSLKDPSIISPFVQNQKPEEAWI